MLHAKRLIFFCLFSCSMSANAWWETAHMMVCDKAYKLLTPSALEIVDPLIKVHESFGRSCLWADWIKAEDRIDTRSWHYINLPDSEQNIYTAKCPENGCLISSFHEQIEILKDESTSARQKQEALWFIGHFIGDIHQPMHVGYPEDRGGNDHLLEFVEKPLSSIEEAWRILKPNGYFIVVLPRRSGLWSRYDNNPFGYGRSYSSRQFKSLIQDFFVLDKI